MKMLDDIHRRLSAEEFEFSRHAFKRAIERNISDAEIRQAGDKPDSLRIIPMTNMLPAV